MPKVSILVPVYNVEKYLIQCIESLVKQTLKDIEIICIDDGSTDNSPVILDEYAMKYSYIRVIHKKNTGYGNSMNVGLKEADGEYVGIVESDDFVDSDMFEKLYSTAKQNDVSIVRSAYYKNANGIDKYEKIRTNDIYKVINPVKNNLDFAYSIPIWSCLYNKSFLNENKIWFNETPGASYQDTGFGLKVLICAKSVVFLQEAFYHYRTDNFESSVHSLAKVFCICDEFKEIWRFIKQRNNIQKSIQYRIPEYQYHHYIYNYNRMADEYKETFINRMVEDFLKLEQDGVLRKEYWNDEGEWLQVRLMIENPEKVMYQQKIRIQNRGMYNIAFQSVLQEYDKIFIYGAGQIGKEVGQYLLKKNIKPAGFFVSNICGQPQVLLDICVCNIDDASEDDRKALVLVSVREDDLYSIMKKLEQMGFKNVIAMTLDMRKGILSNENIKEN